VVEGKIDVALAAPVLGGFDRLEFSNRRNPCEKLVRI
jgi:hypothetical protein